MSEQLQLLSAASPALPVIDDYGPVGRGASQARYVLAENGQEYIAKGPSLTPGHPHVAANELVAARLARARGLPVLDFAVLDLAGERMFGSTWMSKGTYHPDISEPLFSKCQNWDRVYDLVVFDALIANCDRNSGNLIVREVRRQDEGLNYQLVFNDHSHCLVRPGEQATILESRLGEGPIIHLDFVRRAVTETRRLGFALARVADMADQTVRAAFGEMPASFLPSAGDGELMRDFLLARRDRLPEVFRANRAAFPNLDGGDL